MPLHPDCKEYRMIEFRYSNYKTLLEKRYKQLQALYHYYERCYARNGESVDLIMMNMAYNMMIRLRMYYSTDEQAFIIEPNKCPPQPNAQ